MMRLRSKAAFIPALALVAALALSSTTAHAQCEIPGQPEMAASATTTAQAAAVSAMTAGIIAAVESTTTIARAAIVAGMEVGWLALRDRLNDYWKDQQEALKGQAAQLAAGKADQTRQLGSVADVAVLNTAARKLQKLEYDARRTFVTTDEGCRFDTTGPYLGRAMSVTRSIAAGGANEIGAVVNNRKDTPAARGPAADKAARVVATRTMFCDPDNNGGAAGCLSDGGAMADAHVLPSRTIFGAPTLDLTDSRTVPALNALVRNVVGYEAASPMDPKVLKTVPGKQQRLREREIAAQMDAAGGLVWGIAAERMPAGAAPEIEAMRLRLGAKPASAPSEYEIRRQVVEQLWAPSYYVGLQDAPNTLHQKQIHLRAYSVMQLYKLIEKMERISTVYAIQTANLVEKYSKPADASALQRPGLTPAAPAATGGGTP